MTRMVGAIAAGTAVIALSACGINDGTSNTAAPPSSSPAAVTIPASSTDVREYVGKVRDGSHYIAFVQRGDELDAYTCDGTGAFAYEWFTGDPDATSLTSTDGDSTIELTRAGDRITGTIVLDGKTLPFSTEAASGVAGLYVVRASLRSGRVGYRFRSARGATLADLTTESVHGHVRLSGTFREPGEPARTLTLQSRVAAASTRKFQVFRVILLRDRSGRGSVKPGSRTFSATQQASTSGSQWADPTIYF